MAERSAFTPSWIMSTEIKAAATEAAHHQPRPGPITPNRPSAGQPVSPVHQRVGESSLSLRFSASGSSLRSMQRHGRSRVFKWLDWELCLATSINRASGDRFGGSTVARWAVALREFLRSPSLVGSAFPASDYLIDRLLAPVDWTTVKVVVEYGPGTGPITRAALARMRPDSHLLAMDVSEGFTRYLRRSIEDDRLIAVKASAEQVTSLLASYNLEAADVILTGIPFSTLEPGIGDRIADASVAALADDGSFLAYQMRRSVAPLLEARFDVVRSAREWRNIPPCHIYSATKPRSGTR